LTGNPIIQKLYPMRKSIILSATLIWLLFSCTNNELKEEIVDKYPNGAPKKIEYFLTDGDKKELVKETRFFENGEKYMEGEFKNGKKNGKWTAWFENGKKQSEGIFKEGFSNGPINVWNENGTKLYEGYYKSSKPDSIWTFYKPGGEISKKVTFKDGKKISEQAE